MLFTPIIKSFVALKVLIQNERTRWFMARTLRSAFVQGIVRVGYSPLFFYYELLVIVLYRLIGSQSETTDYWEIFLAIGIGRLYDCTIGLLKSHNLITLYLKLNQIFVINLLILTESYNFVHFIVFVVIGIRLKYRLSGI